MVGRCDGVGIEGERYEDLVDLVISSGMPI